MKTEARVLSITQPFPSAEGLLSRPLSMRGMLLSGALWLMVWGTYNAEIWRLFDPDFPANALDLFHGFHGLRTLLPFGAAYLTRWNEVFAVCFCYQARPEVQQQGREAGIRLVFSYGKLV